MRPRHCLPVRTLINGRNVPADFRVNALDIEPPALLTFYQNMNCKRHNQMKYNISHTQHQRYYNLFGICAYDDDEMRTSVTYLSSSKQSGVPMTMRKAEKQGPVVLCSDVAEVFHKGWIDDDDDDDDDEDDEDDEDDDALKSL
ncbi:hypothetical protein PoB_002547200 [Plakobranchus ocellatus]|uniref:Uncharacterized protein n=1 Tax=Plakobranchus ocellatus TaxID=259542 RepID=A0AAV3ZWA2_9GAST|nr:hypothetical protein PoB_002547200 [Plakobranchus ocellatus]